MTFFHTIVNITQNYNFSQIATEQLARRRRLRILFVETDYVWCGARGGALRRYLTRKVRFAPLGIGPQHDDNSDLFITLKKIEKSIDGGVG